MLSLSSVSLLHWHISSRALHALDHRGFGPLLQVLASAFAFGVAHGIWAFFGGRLRAGIGAVAATSILGAGLATVYLISGRSLAPCIVAHFLLDVSIEPGLVLAAARGEMSRSSSDLKTFESQYRYWSDSNIQKNTLSIQALVDATLTWE